MDVSCIVLAGGKAERMGKDKAFVLLDKKPLIYHVLKRLNNIFDDVVVVVKNSSQAKRLKNVKTVCDSEEIFSPLAGIKEGIKHIKNEYFFLTACDMPFIKKNLIKRLIKNIGDAESVVPILDGRYEPFLAIYKKSIFENCSIIESLHSVIKRSKNKTIDVKECDKVNFFNINTKEDLEKAKEVLKGKF